MAKILKLFIAVLCVVATVFYIEANAQKRSAQGGTFEIQNNTRLSFKLVGNPVNSGITLNSSLPTTINPGVRPTTVSYSYQSQNKNTLNVTYVVNGGTQGCTFTLTVPGDGSQPTVQAEAYNGVGNKFFCFYGGPNGNAVGFSSP